MYKDKEYTVIHSIRIRKEDVYIMIQACITIHMYNMR